MLRYTAKQKIDSGFFLHEAELKIKKEKKDKNLIIFREPLKYQD